MRVVDLFSGCGGLSLGMEKAGHDVVAAFDWWDPALAVYRENIKGHPAIKQDLSDVEGSIKAIRPFSPEMIVGGPPCQDFSSAGKRVEGGRADLTECFAKIVCGLSPRWFIMENVDRAEGSAAFTQALSILRAAGYGISKRVLDASLCGCPQKRKRFFCLGKTGEADGFLDTGLEGALAPKAMTMRDWFGGDLGVEAYYRHPRNYARRSVFSMDEPSATIRGVSRPIPPGMKRHPGDAADPSCVRPLTIEERGRVQTFPAGFKWLGSNTAKNQMIGNAVPIELAAWVGRCVVEEEARGI